MSPRRKWDSPTPSLTSECAPLPGTNGGRAHSPAGGGWGSPNSDDCRNSIAPCLFCGWYESAPLHACVLPSPNPEFRFRKK
jgi:hypothetical protein